MPKTSLRSIKKLIKTNVSRKKHFNYNQMRFETNRFYMNIHRGKHGNKNIKLLLDIHNDNSFT